MQLSSKDLNIRRRVVIHHTHLLNKDSMKLLNSNDIVFFDDCLYSQYVFIKNYTKFFIDNNIDCILGFSSGLYANEDAHQIHNIESYILHNACNERIYDIKEADSLRSSIPEMNGFMKVTQLKELLNLPFCHLALHGCCHLKLEYMNCSIIEKMKLFNKDVNDGISQLKMLELTTNIFVYPYVYSLPASDVMLRRKGFSAIIGSTMFRISIENLAHGLYTYDS